MVIWFQITFLVIRVFLTRRKLWEVEGCPRFVQRFLKQNQKNVSKIVKNN